MIGIDGERDAEVASDEPLPSKEPTAADVPPKGTARLSLRVLVVDDEPAICQALTLLLACHGIDVVSVLSAAEAKAALATSRFDVLLIDLRLRDARGDALFRDAIELDPSLHDRTLFMTGDISTEAERVIAATNCPYLRKPFDIMLAVQAIAARAGMIVTG